MAANTPTSNNQDHRFIKQIGDQLFHIEVWLYNLLEEFPKIAIPVQFINGLAIEETLMNFNTKGWIILANDFEVFERGSYDSKDKNGIKSPYAFRTDGRNKIQIKIYPLASDNPTKNQQDNTFPKELWEMSFDFVIYDIEDLPVDNAFNKSRKFYFWDERFQILKERNIEWSTSLKNNGTTDSSRTMTCSEAIKSIIKTVGSDTLKFETPTIKVGSSNGPSGIDSPDLGFAEFDDALWDAGSEDSKIIYTSPANSNAWDDICYILDSIVSEDNISPVFLEFDRYLRDDNTKKWSLIPLKYYFQNAEKIQVERLVVTDNLDPTNLPPYVNRAPVENTSTKNFQSGIASRITSYSFSPMTSDGDFELLTKPIHSFDFSKGQFNIKFKGNKIDDLHDNLNKLGKSGLYSFNGNDGQLLLNINKTKKTSIMIDNVLNTKTFFPKNLSYAQMAKKFLFLNQAIHFTSPGLTLRTPGKFIFIDRDSANNKNLFDDRFLGQWMVTNVIHLFTQSSYTTDVIATKVDMFNTWWNVFDSDKNANY